MWYVIIGAIILWTIFRFKKKKQPQLTLTASIHYSGGGWEEIKQAKLDSLEELKASFQEPLNSEHAISQAAVTLASFHDNHGQSPDAIAETVQSIDLPEDIQKKEAALRKELNKHYKNREELASKSIAIHLAFEHAKFLLQNPEIDWANFSGLQKLQSNWKSQDYFNGLLGLMTAYQKTFTQSKNFEKLCVDTDRMFELWNSQSIADQAYSNNLEQYPKAKSDSDRHFIILAIIEYLDRRYKFNPKHRDQLVDWCHKDVELYESFLKEFHEWRIFSIDQQMAFHDSPELKKEALSKISFERVKKLEGYLVPRLNSYSVLYAIYAQENNKEKLKWLESIGHRIGYIQKDADEDADVKSDVFDETSFLREVAAPKSGQKGKLAFLDSKGITCSTEEVFKDIAEQEGWHVMRAEVSFWQAMFCLAFWEEIFDGMDAPSRFNDIPHDLFKGEEFYLNRKVAIDNKYAALRTCQIADFINKQIKSAEGTWTRLIYNDDHDMLTYAKTAIVQSFLKRIDSEVFAKIVYRIAQNINDNRSGLPDFVIWNETELRLTEVKGLREQVRDAQKIWLTWLHAQNIQAEIVRVRPLKT